MTTSGPFPHPLANDFRPCLGFPLSMPEPLKNGDPEGMVGSECKISPVSSPGALSVVSSPALPTESATTSSPPAIKSDSSSRQPVAEKEENTLLRGVICPTPERGRIDDLGDPLAQLQNALEKNGMLGRKLEVPRLLSPGVVTQDDYHASPDIEKQIIPYSAHQDGDITGEVFRCHICTYTSSSKFHFNSHMNTHFDHKCPFCDYTSRTEGRLKRHVKDFHSEIPPESWAGTRIPREDGCDNSNGSSGGKVRNYRCKQCNYVAFSKTEFWDHNKSHIKAEKLLTCPKCPFVTEYKHHLEYHLRNHFGSKPFKCNKCNYSCVNKSMLNSHMKSHSNVYQYRCSDCNYATKYCHSLKLHLRKYNHKPSTVLNMDGSPNPFPVIDVYGSRRGPRPKKHKHEESHNIDSNSLSPIGHIHNQTPPMGGYANIPPIIPTTMGLPFLYPSHLINNFQNNIFLRPPILGPQFRPPLMPPENPDDMGTTSPNGEVKYSTPFKCSLCEFATDIKEMFTKHLLLHAANENQDLCNLYGINTDSLALEQSVPHVPHRDASSQVPKIQPRDLKSDRSDNDHRSEIQLFGNESNNCTSHIEDEVFEDRGEDSSSSQSTEDGADFTAFSSTPNVNSQEKEAANDRSSSGGCDLSPLSSFDEEVKDMADRRRKTESSFPLDLSSHRDSFCAPSPSEKTTVNEQSDTGSNNQNNTGHFPRNRRKGKAFKLNRICLRLQDQGLSYGDQMEEDEDFSAQNPTTLPEDFSEEMECEFGPQQQRSANNGDVSPTVQVKVPNGSDLVRTQPPSGNPKQVPKPQQQSSPNDVLCRLRALANSTSDDPQQQQVVTTEQATVENAKKNGCSKQHEYRVISQPSPPPPTKTSTIDEGSFITYDKDFVKDQKDAAKLESKWKEAYTCNYCDMSFKDCVMYTVHMGYHGYQDPFKCNMCGQLSKDKVGFFLHIARAAHL